MVKGQYKCYLCTKNSPLQLTVATYIHVDNNGHNFSQWLTQFSDVMAYSCTVSSGSQHVYSEVCLASNKNNHWKIIIQLSLMMQHNYTETRNFTSFLYYAQVNTAHNVLQVENNLRIIGYFERIIGSISENKRIEQLVNFGE